MPYAPQTMCWSPLDQPASHWLARLEQPGAIADFRAAYGDRDDVLLERAALVRRTVELFFNRFGDHPVRVFRAPGRINLRGMHVDTHGGFLNLMTHQREVVFVASPAKSGRSVLVNASPRYGETTFALKEELGSRPIEGTWSSLVEDPVIRSRIARRRETQSAAWANYCIGAALRAWHMHPASETPELLAAVGSDLPKGAALSSSAALIVAALLAYSHCGGHCPDAKQLIPAAQDVEWYAGARVGMSDQTAVLLGRLGRLLHLSVFAEDFSLADARHLCFPDDLVLLVANSFTARDLSGPQRIPYSLNRFAYSMAMTVLRTELIASGWSPDEASALDRLSRLTPERLGGLAALYRLVGRIPETIGLEQLRDRYAPHDLDAAYARYFGDVPCHKRPNVIPIRGPLLFGMAESERARLFPDLLAKGEYERAGLLMSIGHDGDRVRGRDGGNFSVDVGDHALERMALRLLPLACCPGAYGASSPALDALVDVALSAGALGASLTGAGIAGAVLALCGKNEERAVSDALNNHIRSDAYARLAAWREAPSESDFDRAVTPNRAVAGACELLLDAE